MSRASQLVDEYMTRSSKRFHRTMWGKAILHCITQMLKRAI